ncbi:MAG: class I SAM-dependent methyltransferase [Dongiaceae bacterium]
MKIIDERLRVHPLGFLQVASVPSADELKAYYADLYYQAERGSYRKAYSADERAYLDLKIAQKASIVSALRGTVPGSLLDVGCGEGFVLNWFRDAGWSVRGVDHSRAGLEAMNPHLLPQVEVGDLFSLLSGLIERGERYEVVWLSNVLEHVPDPVGLLASLRRLVAADGVLVVTVPNDGSALQEELLKLGHIPERFWIAIPDHLAYFSHDSLTRVAQATGWSCREIVADFPIDWFLLHPGSNYVRDRTNGPAAHQARIRLELLLAEKPHEIVNQFYVELARVGLGRNLTAFLLP